MSSLTPLLTDVCPSNILAQNAHLGQFIGNQWPLGDGAVINPFTQTEIAQVPAADKKQILAALDGAKATTYTPDTQQRKQILWATAQHYRQYQTDVARLITAESGLCLKDTLHEVSRSIAALEAAGR